MDQKFILSEVEIEIAETDVDHVEQQVWDTEDKIIDSPTAIGKQSETQKGLLYQLSIKNILDSYQPNLLSRFLVTANIEWFTPEFVTFLNVDSVRIKNDHGISFPFLVCSQFQTSPLLKRDEKYLVAIVDYESEKLQSKLLEIYIKNVALTLESAVKHQNNVVGASLIVKGRLSKDLLTWFRGSSPLDPSPIPHVEIIYGIPLENSNHLLLSQDYLFTLKQGTGYRLKKNNNKTIIPSAKKVYQDWQKLRPYVVIDQLINEAVFDSNDFMSFIHAFWKLFNGLSNPQFDLPKLIEISQMEEKELTLLVIEKVNLYRKKVEEEAQCKILARKNKAQKLLEEFNDSLIDKVIDRVKEIANKSSGNYNLFYLDWSHIIYDALKNKAYDLEFDNIQSITLEVLNQKNVNAKFYRNICKLKLDDLSKEFDGKLRFHFNEKPDCIGFSSDYSNRLFNWTLLTIITIYMQLDEKKKNTEVRKFITTFINSLFQSISNKRDYSFFYQFIEDFETAKNQLQEAVQETRENKHEMVDEILGFFKNESSCSQFNRDILDFFINSLKIKLEEIKQNEEKLKRRELDDSANEEINWSLFEKDDNKDETNIEETPQTDTTDEIVLTLQKACLDENGLTNLLEKTPLFDDISLNDFKHLLEQYGEKFDTCEITRSNDNDIEENINYMKLEKINELVTFYYDMGNTFDHIWRYFFFFNIYTKNENIVKYIYVITEQDEIKVAHEPIGRDVSQRPCHSQLANGLGVKAAGELIFQYDNNSSTWSLVVVNNGSGHYRPPAHICLPEAKEKILFQLNPYISQHSVSLLNSLKPGMTLASGWEDDKIELFIKPSEVFITSQELDNIEKAKEASQREAQAARKIGPRQLDGWILHDVDVKGKGNCLYKAIAYQLERMKHEFIKKVPPTTKVHRSLRLRAEKERFKDRQWGNYPEIWALCDHEELNIVIAIVDTGTPTNYVYYYTDQNGGWQSTRHEQELPQEKQIVKLAYTGNHYLAVVKEPANFLLQNEPEVSCIFSFTAQENTSYVYLLGDFNGRWEHSNQYVMQKGEDDIWKITVSLLPGKYEFKYFSHGNFLNDPTCPKTNDMYENSILNVEDPFNMIEHIFTFPGIGNGVVNIVHVAGTFNDWLFAENGVIKEGVRSNQYQMEKSEEGTWQLKVFLPEGQYEFQYIINGGGQGYWYLDETCKQHYTGKYINSVIDIRSLQQIEETILEPKDSDEEISRYFVSPISQPLPASNVSSSCSKEESSDKKPDEKNEKTLNL